MTQLATTFDPAELQALAETKTAMWAAVREQRIADSLALSKDLDALCEDFRRKYFPRAREVVAICDRAIGQPLTIYRRTPTGRAVLVYDEEATR